MAAAKRRRKKSYTGKAVAVFMVAFTAVVGAVLMSVFVHHPLQHASSSVVIEVGIDIRQRDTVRIEETLEQQVVFQRVYLGDT